MKTIFVTLILFMATETFCQFTKGQMLAGGSGIVSIDNSNSTETRDDNTITDNEFHSSSWSIRPMVGYFLKDSIAVGIGFEIGSDKGEFTNDFDPNKFISTNKNQTTGVYIFARKYYRLYKKLGCFVDLEIGYNRTERDDDSTWEEDGIISRINEYSEESDLFFSNVGLNVYYLITKRITLETRLFELSYSSRSSESESSFLFVNEVQNESTTEWDSNSFDFNLINEFSFDRVFTINYYF